MGKKTRNAPAGDAPTRPAPVAATAADPALESSAVAAESAAGGSPTEPAASVTASAGVGAASAGLTASATTSPPTPPTRSRPAYRPPRVQSLAVRWWLNPTFHLILRCAMAIAAIWGWAKLHLALEPEYIQSVEATLTNAADSFDLHLSAGGQLEITVSGEALDRLSAGGGGGPLGLANMASVRSVIDRHQAAANAAAAGVQVAFLDKLALFSRLPGRRGARVDLPHDATGQRFLQLSRASFDTLVSAGEQPGVGLALALERALLSADLFSTETLPAAAGGQVTHGDLPRSVQRARDAVLRVQGRQPEPYRELTLGPDEQRAVRQWCAEVNAGLGSDATPARAADDGGSAFASSSTASLHQALQARRASLRSDVAEAGMLEVSPWVWMYGSWRWFDLVAWTIFGVLANALWGLAAIASGARQIRKFEPNETLRTISRMICAPFLSTVFLFMLLSADLVELDGAVRDPSSLFLFGFVFLIGMRPDDIYGFLINIFKRLLRSDDEQKTHEDKQGWPDAVRVLKSERVLDRAPDFSALAAEVADHVMAPLQGVASVSPREP